MKISLPIILLGMFLCQLAQAQKAEIRHFDDAPFLFDDISSDKLFYLYEGGEYRVSYFGNHYGSIVKKEPAALKEIKIYRNKARTSVALYSLAGLFVANYFVFNNNYAANNESASAPKANFLAINISGVLASTAGAFFLKKSGRNNVIRSANYYTNYRRNNGLVMHQ